MAVLSKVCIPDNFDLHNSLKLTSLKLDLWIFVAFVQILLIVNLSLNQTPDILERQTCMTQLILAISSFNLKEF